MVRSSRVRRSLLIALASASIATANSPQPDAIPVPEGNPHPPLGGENRPFPVLNTTSSIPSGTGSGYSSHGTQTTNSNSSPTNISAPASSPSGPPEGNSPCSVCYWINDNFDEYTAVPSVTDIITETIIPHITVYDDGQRVTSYSTVTITSPPAATTSRAVDPGPTGTAETDPENFYSELVTAHVTVTNNEYEYDGYTFNISQTYYVQTEDAEITLFSPLAPDFCVTRVISGGLPSVYGIQQAATQLPLDINSLWNQQWRGHGGILTQPAAPLTSCVSLPPLPTGDGGATPSSSLPVTYLPTQSSRTPTNHSPAPTFSVTNPAGSTYTPTPTNRMQWAASLTHTTGVAITHTAGAGLKPTRPASPVDPRPGVPGREGELVPVPEPEPVPGLEGGSGDDEGGNGANGGGGNGSGGNSGAGSGSGSGPGSPYPGSGQSSHGSPESGNGGSSDGVPGNGSNSGPDPSPSVDFHAGTPILCALGNRAACASSRPSGSGSDSDSDSDSNSDSNPDSGPDAPSYPRATLTASSQPIPVIRLPNGALELAGTQTITPGTQPVTVNGEAFSFPAAPTPTPGSSSNPNTGSDSGSGSGSAGPAGGAVGSADAQGGAPAAVPTEYTFLAAPGASPGAQTLSFSAEPTSGSESGDADVGLEAATQTLTAPNGAVLTAVVPAGGEIVLVVNGVSVSVGGPEETVDGVRVGLETGAGGVDVELGVVGEESSGVRVGVGIVLGVGGGLLVGMGLMV